MISVSTARSVWNGTAVKQIHLIEDSQIADFVEGEPPVSGELPPQRPFGQLVSAGLVSSLSNCAISASAFSICVCSTVASSTMPAALRFSQSFFIRSLSYSQHDALSLDTG